MSNLLKPRCVVGLRLNQQHRLSRQVWLATALTMPLIFLSADRARSQGLISQGIPSETSEVGRNHAETLNEILNPITRSVVRIRNHDRLCCLGTIVGDGLVISKNSELFGSLTCTAADGTEAAGTIIASDSSSDLALLQLSLEKAQAKSFGRAIDLATDKSVAPGDVFFSVGRQSNLLSTGIATVDPQPIQIKQPACRDCVDLGVTVSPETSEVEFELATGDGEPGKPQYVSGTKIERVYPRTVAERIGLLEGDLLVSINQQWVPDAKALRSIGSRVRVGQRLELIVVRAGALKQLGMEIDHFSRRVYHDRWGGGPFSERRFGFGKTIVHDSLLKPDQCGGPLVDLNGKVVGINIARSMRVATFAIPADRVLALVNRVKPASN